jgi:uncharacterized membrane protein YfcA
LLLLLAAIALAFTTAWFRHLARRRDLAGARPRPIDFAIGAVTNFFDTLGVGSFATTTAIYRVRKLVADERIPGTLNVGHTLPTFAQAFIYVAIVAVEPVTLWLLIGASVLGAWLGAGVVAGLSRRKVQLGMGAALLFAALLMLTGLVGAGPAGGEALGLHGVWLGVGLVACFAFGALMTIGVGAYAPIMITVALLGMNPTAAFPIMMGACAFLMPVASQRFVRAEKYAPGAALGLALGGVPAVLLAAYLVKSLPLAAVKWLVVVVVVYTAVSMLRSGAAPQPSAPAAGSP